MASPSCIAIDWSGDATERGQRTRIVAAIVHEGRVAEVTGGRTRAEVAHWLAAMATAGAPLLVGLDFSFSLPEWFAREHECHSIEAVWELVAERAEPWLRGCAPPFWGRPGVHCEVEAGARYRVCEQQLRARGRQPKSIFQVGGAGSVGTGSLRGMPWLAWLRERGFAIWPFDAVGLCTAFEVYPSLFARVATNDAIGRAAHLAPLSPAVLGAREREAAIASDDAFDAVVSALAMWDRRAELLALPRTSEAVAAIEGAVWV